MPGAPPKSLVAKNRRLSQAPLQVTSFFENRLLSGGQEVKREGKATHRILQVEVLMDKNAFSESSLRILFQLLSQRFPKPELLMMDIFTSLEQIDTPEESDRKMHHSEPNAQLYNYHLAYMERAKDTELIRYTTSLPSAGFNLRPST